MSDESKIAIVYFETMDQYINILFATFRIGNYLSEFLDVLHGIGSCLKQEKNQFFISMMNLNLIIDRLFDNF